MSNNTGKFTDIIKTVIWVSKLLFKFSPGLLASVLLTQIITAIAPFARTKILSQLIDSIVGSSNDNWINSFVLFMIISLVTTLFFYLQGQLNRVLDIHLQSHLRKTFINKVAHLDYQHLESSKSASLISKVDEEFGWRTRKTVGDLTNLVFNFMSLVAITIIILPKYPVIWLIIMLAQIPQYFVQRYWVRKDWELYENNTDKNKQRWDLNYQLRQKNYIAELRINNAIDHLVAKFSEIFDFFTKETVSISIRKTPSEVVVSILTLLVGGASLLIIINDVRAGLLTIGAFTFYFDTIRRVSEVFQQFVYTSVSITENSYHIDNFREVLELTDNTYGGSKTINTSKPPKIEFQGVSFRYPSSQHYVFKDLSLTIMPGEEIALVGENGAGKSTLIKLLCCFYYPTSGRILIDGIDTRELSLSSWYKNLAYLTQEFNNFGNMTLAENVAFGNPNKKYVEANIVDALKSADAKFWKKYSKGLATIMSQRYGGEEPSWGQWQKISIARIFYRNSTVMILDEPTASIDAVSEYKIFNELYRSVSGKTMIIVSHRFSTVRNAQRIIVLSKGSIVEQGSHKELVDKNGIYAKSFALQAEGYN